MGRKKENISIFEFFSPKKQSPEKKCQIRNTHEIPEQKSFSPTEIKQELTENIFIKQEIIDPDPNSLWFVLESKNSATRISHAYFFPSIFLWINLNRRVPE